MWPKRNLEGKLFTEWLEEFEADLYEVGLKLNDFTESFLRDLWLFNLDDEIDNNWMGAKADAISDFARSMD